ncbi:MAG: hypothetical protein ABL974_21490 [Prosthecobacter sp.]
MTSQPPSFTKAFKENLFPAMAAMGFKPDGSKRFRRVIDGVLQFLILTVETRLRREFSFAYGAILICEPPFRDDPVYSLSHGGNFPVNPIGYWNGQCYLANTEVSLQKSIERVQRDFPALLEWFEKSGSLNGYLTTFRERLHHDPSKILTDNGHSYLALACGEVLAGNLTAAEECANKALSDFTAIHHRITTTCPDMPVADLWTPERISRCEELLHAIQNNASRMLVEGWAQKTSSIYKL